MSVLLVRTLCQVLENDQIFGEGPTHPTVRPIVPPYFRKISKIFVYTPLTPSNNSNISTLGERIYGIFNFSPTHYIRYKESLSTFMTVLRTFLFFDEKRPVLVLSKKNCCLQRENFVYFVWRMAKNGLKLVQKY